MFDDNSQIANAHLGRWSHAVPGLSGEAQYPRARIVNIDLGITGVDRLQRNTIPTTEFNQILDRCHSDLQFQEKFENKQTGTLVPKLTPSIAG